VGSNKPDDPNRMRERSLKRAAAPVLIAVAIGSVACTSKNSAAPNAKSPEVQSDAEYDLAKDFFGKGKPREALDHANKAVALNEENDKAHYMVAAILMQFCSSNRGLAAPDCRLGDVEKSARAALKANPDFRDAKNFLGNVLILQKRYKDAIAVLEPLTKDPAYVQSYLAWGNLGWAQTEDGQLDPAITSLRNAVGTEPRFCVGHYRLGLALEKKNDLPNAEQSLTTALTADPQCDFLQDGWEGRGRVRAKLGKNAEACTDFKRCEDISKETETGQRCARERAKLPATCLVAVNPNDMRKT
jgi:type IV pilus assembly protein PilF